MYAIIETGGKQYKVEVGTSLFVEKLNVAAGETVTFDKVLVVSKDDKVVVGSPVVAGAAVKAEVVEEGKGPRSLFTNTNLKNLTTKNKVIVNLSQK